MATQQIKLSRETLATMLDLVSEINLYLKHMTSGGPADTLVECLIDRAENLGVQADALIGIWTK